MLLGNVKRCYVLFRFYLFTTNYNIIPASITNWYFLSLFECEYNGLKKLNNADRRAARTPGARDIQFFL